MCICVGGGGGGRQDKNRNKLRISSIVTKEFHLVSVATSPCNQLSITVGSTSIDPAAIDKIILKINQLYLY